MSVTKAPEATAIAREAKVHSSSEKHSANAGSDNHKDVEKHPSGHSFAEGIPSADDRPEANATDSVYSRKVYLVNRVMNENSSSSACEGMLTSARSLLQIGMGRFQWALFCLSGLGWLLDNLWLQAVAIILPQIQNEFGIEHPQFMTLSLYIGLIIGASLWGVLADVIGRRPSFNVTLFLAGVFGVVGGAAPSFVGLGGILAALGIGLGGNLPVDGMLFLEFIPGANQYLLTLLSVYWSLGQLIASLLAWVLIANFSCAEDATNVPSRIETLASQGIIARACLKADNMGWRYAFFTFGGLTLVCFILRFFVFNLPESPKYLIAKGRDSAAVKVLKDVAARNGVTLTDEDISVDILKTAAGEKVEEADLAEEKDESVLKTMLRGVSMKMFTPELSHVRPLFSGCKLAYNTSIIILLWGMIGLAYPLYNAFLPIYLSRAVGDAPAPTTNETYKNYAIISVCGVPGSIIAAWLVELPRSGRRGAMSLGTVLTGVFLFAFTAARTSAQNLAFNCVTALTQNIMYGVLYGYTPEVFPAPHRGTGDGIAASFNRICGLMAPIIAIYGSANNPNVPVYVSAALFVLAGLLMVTLQIESQGKTAL
ncbi:MFS general substrate transporter [Tilletiaria anomala UBC 951]|uniref:MFS general substrate transporter n=1 Tax=Tilletiaria anomala (strain ATCC 24038 / CBS 436.72 / UBC 951) TaxID=1037660 RepID=A0A066VQQ3_TILAU|nr:MFS general substrate transporter [Tilletiaria anomala UBC 951]KDN42608.1 MFS general substrate transporter [Tilletiaria anomala UBC 951]